MPTEPIGVGFWTICCPFEFSTKMLKVDLFTSCVVSQRTVPEPLPDRLEKVIRTFETSSAQERTLLLASGQTGQVSHTLPKPSLSVSS